MNAIQSVMKMHTRNKYNWFITPCIVLSSSFIIGLLVSVLLNENTAIYSGAVGSIYIFFFALGIISLNDTFPFALGFGVRRTDYFLGTALLVVLLHAVISIILMLLALFETHVVHYWGVRLHFFSLPYVNDGSIVEQLWISFALLVHMYFFGFAIGSIYRRFGKTGMWTFFVLAFLLISTFVFLSTSLHWWSALLAWFSRSTAFELALWLTPLTVGHALVAYVLLRKATI